MSTLILVLLYGVVILAISYSLRKHTDADDYLMGGRSASALLVGGALFTLVGGGELITLTALAFTSGYSALALFAGYSLGFVYLATMAKRIRSNPDSKNFLSLPDYIHAKFGRLAGHLVFLVSFGAFFAMLLIQFTAGGQLLQPLLKLEYVTCVLITAAIAASYLLIGGFRTVLATDLLQGVSRLLLLPLIIYAVSQGIGADRGNSASSPIEMLPIPILVSLIVTGFFAAAASSDVWQRIYAARSAMAARNGFLLGAASLLIFGYLLVQLGLLAHAGAITQNPDSAFVAALGIGLPVWALHLAVILVLSTILGTADTEIFLLSGMLGRELSRLRGGKNAEDVSRAQSVLQSRVLVILVAVAAVAFSLVFRELIPIYTWLLCAILVIAPMVVASLYLEARRGFVVASVTLNLLVFLIMASLGLLSPETAYWIVIPGFLMYGVAYVIGKGSANDARITK